MNKMQKTPKCFSIPVNAKALVAMTLLLALALPALASAKTYEITLLTVGESKEDSVGGIAKAYLEIKPGSGRIFIDSFPLTKLDTQISTRYANQIACDYLEYDCSRHDFFYTIRADSAIVGGPSASAPLTVLTISAIKGVELNIDTVMTGTINSGGSIGPVGGIRKKAMAAQEVGFKKIIIPKFSISDSAGTIERNKSLPRIGIINVITYNNSTNYTIRQGSNGSVNQSVNQSSNYSVIINVSEQIDNSTIIEDEQLLANTTWEQGLSIEVLRVSNLDQALAIYSRGSFTRQEQEIRVPQDYSRIMKEVAESLCSNAASLKHRLKLTSQEINRSIELENKSNVSFEKGLYYSSASYCFNLGVMLRRINMQKIEEENPLQLEQVRIKALTAVHDFDKKLEELNITTLPGLEAYIIVKERIIESDRELQEISGNISSDKLAYAIERYYSALYWSKFFEMKGKPIKLDQTHLEDACSKKISEAEERINYAELYLPDFTHSARNDLAEALAHQKLKNYEMCLFKASFSKSQANLILSTLAVGGEKLGELSSEKINSAKKLIAKEAKYGFFPIMGYSYYEYAKTLHDNNDQLSGLIFSEYSLELSNIDMYFPRKENASMNINLDSGILLLAASTTLLGIIIGLLIAGALANIRRKKSQKRLLSEKPRILSQSKKLRLPSAVRFGSRKQILNPKKTSERGLPGKKR
jgi:predicted S18 family serine protease